MAGRIEERSLIKKLVSMIHGASFRDQDIGTGDVVRLGRMEKGGLSKDILMRR